MNQEDWWGKMTIAALHHSNHRLSAMKMTSYGHGHPLLRPLTMIRYCLLLYRLPPLRWLHRHLFDHSSVSLSIGDVAQSEMASAEG